MKQTNICFTRIEVVSPPLWSINRFIERECTLFKAELDLARCWLKAVVLKDSVEWLQCFDKHPLDLWRRLSWVLSRVDPVAVVVLEEEDVGGPDKFWGTMNAELLRRLWRLPLVDTPWELTCCNCCDFFCCFCFWCFVGSCCVSEANWDGGDSLPDSEDAPDGDVVVTSVEELGIMIAWFGFTPRRTARTRCLWPKRKYMLRYISQS